MFSVIISSILMRNSTTLSRIGAVPIWAFIWGKMLSGKGVRRRMGIPRICFCAVGETWSALLDGTTCSGKNCLVIWWWVTAVFVLISGRKWGDMKFMQVRREKNRSNERATINRRWRIWAYVCRWITVLQWITGYEWARITCIIIFARRIASNGLGWTIR